MSRPSLSWGIPLPWDDSQVAYVWFDALINYVSAAGFSDDPDRFVKAMARVGPSGRLGHPAFSRGPLAPAMLMSAGLALPRQIAVHGWLLVGGEKMSKSNATRILPSGSRAASADGYRYHFLLDVSFGLDSNFSWEGMVDRYNADLANDFVASSTGVLNIAVSYRGGNIPAVSDHGAAEEAVLVATAAEALAALDGFAEFRTKQALDGVWRLFGCRQCAASKRPLPWHLAKNPEMAESP